MTYLGDIRLGDTFDCKFCTVTTTGAPTQLAGSPVISAYPGNSTTQLTAGITLSVDFDTVTGLNNVRVVATSGNGYATATNYQLVITTGTVGGTSVVGYVVAQFSIEARSAVMPTTAARTLDVSATGEAGVDWANVGSPTTSLALTGTTIATTQKVDIETIKTNPVVNAGTVTFPTTATLASTTNITAGTITTVTTTTTATNLTNAPTAGDFTATMKTSIGTAVAASAVASVTAAVTVGTNNDKTGYGLSAAAVQAVWDALTSALTTVGSIGKKLADWTIGTAQTGDAFTRLGAPAGASVSVDIAAVKSDTAAILVDTGTTLDGRIPVALVGGRMDASVGAMAADTLTASALAADAVDEILDEAIGDSTITMRQALKILVAALAGKLSGAATTTVTIRNAADDTNRIVATVDADGNRSAVTLSV